MLTTIRGRWQDLVHGLWFRPGLVVLVCAALAVGTLVVDHLFPVTPLVLTFGGNAAGARAILTTIASSFITVAGVSLSITILTVQLVSGQFSPRAVRDLLADQTTQLTMGGLFGIFIYCLIVLRSVRSAVDGAAFVPALSVSIAILLGVVGLGLILAFVHGISQSIQVGNIVSRVAAATDRAMEELYPQPFTDESGSEDPDAIVRAWRATGPAREVCARRDGFVQNVTLADVFAGQRSARVHILVRPGDFVRRGSVLAELWGRDGDRLGRVVQRAVVVGAQRDVSQDAAFGLRLLSDIAIRTAPDDPTSTTTCCAYLGACLVRLAGQRIATELHRDDDGTVCAVVRRPGFDDLLAPVEDVVRYVRHEPRATAMLLDGVRVAAERAEERGARARLARLRRLAGEIEREARSA